MTDGAQGNVFVFQNVLNQRFRNTANTVAAGLFGLIQGGIGSIVGTEKGVVSMERIRVSVGPPSALIGLIPKIRIADAGLTRVAPPTTLMTNVHIATKIEARAGDEHWNRSPGTDGTLFLSLLRGISHGEWPGSDWPLPA